MNIFKMTDNDITNVNLAEISMSKRNCYECSMCPSNKDHKGYEETHYDRVQNLEDTKGY